MLEIGQALNKFNPFKTAAFLLMVDQGRNTRIPNENKAIETIKIDDRQQIGRFVNEESYKSRWFSKTDWWSIAKSHKGISDETVFYW